MICAPPSHTSVALNHLALCAPVDIVNFSNKEFNFIDLCELPYNMKLITIPYVVSISHHNYGLVFHTVRGFPQ